MILLIRPNSKKKNYQGLANNLAAIEPPLWMALRARHLISLGEEVKVLDLEVEDIPKKIDSKAVEIFPLGNHPSAYIQQREGIENIVKKVSGKVKIWKTIPEFGQGKFPAWKLFDLNKYRAHNWHCWGGRPRSPYVTTYTSVSCPFNCNFCNIKAFYKGYKERDISDVIREFNYNKKIGVKNIKLLDEMFFCNWERVRDLSMTMLTRRYDFNIWAYARIDTIKKGIEKCPELFHYMSRAGFRWLGLGIESGNEKIRKKAHKGKFNNEDIRKVVQQLQNAGIRVGANYIFGFYDDDLKSMQQTIDFAKELNCEYSNFYTMMAYPGSQLHEEAKKRKWALPKTWSGYSQYSYDCCPLKTKYLTNAKVLQFRDEAFQEYYTSDRYLKMNGEKFGENTVDEIKNMTKVKQKRN